MTENDLEAIADFASSLLLVSDDEVHALAGYTKELVACIRAERAEAAAIRQERNALLQAASGHATAIESMQATLDIMKRNHVEQMERANAERKQLRQRLDANEVAYNEHLTKLQDQLVAMKGSS